MESTAIKKNTRHRNHEYHSLDSLIRYADFLKFGDVHVRHDEKTGLRAIIAVNNTKLGPSFGGCRFKAYETIDKAFEDVLKLARMMSIKSAVNNVPHGGGKAVLLKPKIIKDYDAYFELFGDFIESLGGQYITAIDSGTSPKEMDIIARRTSYVACTTALGGDPSPETAIGVHRGIEAAVQWALSRSSLNGVHVVIQGAGHVGYSLAKLLLKSGARITMSDINQIALQKAVDDLNVGTCSPDVVYDIKADVFAPCALGGVLNLNTIKRLKVPIVAGSANNQLAHHHYGALLRERGILYAPDFVINAGGLIHAANLYDHQDVNKSVEQIKRISDTLLEIFEHSAKENMATNEVAEKIAIEKLQSM